MYNALADIVVFQDRAFLL